MPLEQVLSSAFVKLVEISPALGILVYLLYRQNMLLERFLAECWQHLLADARRRGDESTDT